MENVNLLYVADTDNNRIQIIDLDGSCSSSEELANDVCFVDEFGTSGNDEGEFRAPNGLALDTTNDLLYVADTDNNRVQMLVLAVNDGGSSSSSKDVPDSPKSIVASAASPSSNPVCRKEVMVLFVSATTILYESLPSLNSILYPVILGTLSSSSGAFHVTMIEVVDAVDATMLFGESGISFDELLLLLPSSFTANTSICTL